MILLPADKQKISPEIYDSFHKLWDKITIYNSTADFILLEKAFHLAYSAHNGQVRRSGQPYITHPLAVADFLADKKMDIASIITAILHDVVEDCDVSQQEITDNFGQEISDLVAGVTKLGNVQFNDYKEKQAKNFRKFILATAKDIRVLLIKLADRTHNLSTINHLREDKRKRICNETLNIFVPLANRIGVHDWMEILQDISFRELQPSAYDYIYNKLDHLKKEQDSFINNIIADLTSVMKHDNISCDISGRIKSAYSIWRKIESKKISIDNVHDIVAFRIVVNNIQQCYQVLGILHHHYKIIPGRFKDYISLPKANGYQSLHTGVIDDAGHRMELQIRTYDMHEVAELGIAAHWNYKQSDNNTMSRDKQYRWVRELSDTLDSSGDSEELIANSGMDMYDDNVFLFTPKGELYTLPRNATAIDFAYAVHTHVGNHCVGAKVNGRTIPIRQALHNGDQVEILTRKDASPSQEWVHFVITNKAKAHIRRACRLRQKKEFINLGKARLENITNQHKVNFPERVLKAYVRKEKYNSIDDLYHAVGENKITPYKILGDIYPNYQQPLSTKKSSSKKAIKKNTPKISHSKIAITGLTDGIAIQFGKCCHPLPGDRIIGIVTTGKGVTVHRIGCLNLEKFVSMPDRWLDIAWKDDNNEKDHFIGCISVTLSNEPASLSAVVDIIGKANISIDNLKFTSHHDDFSEIVIKLVISRREQLEDIITSLQILANVYSVKRFIN